MNWNWGGNRQTLVPELEGLSGLQRLERMAATDETVGAMMWSIESNLGQLTYSHTPQVDGKEALPDHPEYQKAVDHAVFCDSMLDDMDHSMAEHIDEALTMVWAGFAPCEIVLKQRDADNSKYPDGYYGIKSLNLKDQLAVGEWVYSEKNELTGMSLSTMEGEAVIPYWKLLHYRTKRILNNPFGRSLLTNAYRPWYLKNRIQDSEAIGIDRELTGLPIIEVPDELIAQSQETVSDDDPTPTPAAIMAQARIRGAMKAVQDMRFNEVGGMVMPSDTYLDDQDKPSAIKKYDFRIVSTSGQRAIDTRSAARDYDRAVARTLMMQFLHLGDRSSGSFALSDNQTAMALKSLNAIIGKIVGEYDRKLLPLVWRINAYDPRFMPSLTHSAIAEDSLEQLGLFIQRIADGEALLADNPRVLETLFGRAGLTAAERRYTPEKKPELVSVAEPPAPAIGGPKPAPKKVTSAGAK